MLRLKLVFSKAKSDRQFVLSLIVVLRQLDCGKVLGVSFKTQQAYREVGCNLEQSECLQLYDPASAGGIFPAAMLAHACIFV